MGAVLEGLPDRLIILDGGMGQELINRNVSGQGVLWSAKALFDHPQAVQAVHEDYIRAGADVICIDDGPGPYTGLRAGIATAQAFAAAIGAPMVTMSSHSSLSSW